MINELSKLAKFKQKLRTIEFNFEKNSQEELILHLEEFETSIKHGHDNVASTMIYFKGVLYGLVLANIIDWSDHSELLDLLQNEE